MKRRIIVLMGLLIMILPINLQAKTKSMTVYNKVIKDGNTAYCGDTGIYKVNLKSGKVNVLVKNNWCDSTSFTAMKKKGSWIYFLWNIVGEESPLYRVNINNKKLEKIGTGKRKIDGDLTEIYVKNYVISSSKIYYSGIYFPASGSFKKVMRLNGKNKKNTNVNIKMKRKKSNTKGYSLIVKFPENGDCRTWLKMPKKKIYLGESGL